MKADKCHFHSQTLRSAGALYLMLEPFSHFGTAWALWPLHFDYSSKNSLGIGETPAQCETSCRDWSGEESNCTHRSLSSLGFKWIVTDLPLSSLWNNLKLLIRLMTYIFEFESIQVQLNATDSFDLQLEQLSTREFLITPGLHSSQWHGYHLKNIS